MEQEPEGVKVITIVDLEGLPEGSVLQDCTEIDQDGVKCWYGTHASMRGTYMELVQQADCEIWSEQTHDPVSWLWRQREVTDRAADVPGEVPWLIVKHQIRAIANGIVSALNNYQKKEDDVSVVRDRYWLRSLLVYKAKHYPTQELEVTSTFAYPKEPKNDERAWAEIKKAQE